MTRNSSAICDRGASGVTMPFPARCARSRWTLRESSDKCVGQRLRRSLRRSDARARLPRRPGRRRLQLRVRRVDGARHWRRHLMGLLRDLRDFDSGPSKFLETLGGLFNEAHGHSLRLRAPTAGRARAGPRQRIRAAPRPRRGSRSVHAIPCASAPSPTIIDTVPSTGNPVVSRSIRTSKNVGQTWLAAKLAKSPAASETRNARGQERQAIGRDRARRNPRRIDQPKIGAGNSLHLAGDFGGFAARDKTLVVLLVDVIVPIQRRELRLHLGHQFGRFLEPGEACLVFGDARAQRRDSWLRLPRAPP